VISTVTVELYGTATTSYNALQAAADELMQRLAREPFVVDIDSSVEAQQTKLTFVTDKEKAALSGIATEDIARTLALALQGHNAGFLQIPTEANPLPIIVGLPLAQRSSPQALMDIAVKGRPGITKVRDKDSLRDAPQPLVQLGELGAFQQSRQDQTIYHKNLQRVVYVFAELAGRPPAAVVLDVAADVNKANGEATRALWQRTYFKPGGGDGWYLPDDIRAVWSGEGEWDITLRVFRDLGIAFGVALLGIFVILMVQTGSATLAGIIMLAIPLTVIGIMPGFWLLNQLGERVIAGFPNPVLFTATAMIGMIALAGIVVRNSLILIEFIHLALGQGMSLREALIQAGAIRMRPIFLTALTTLLGNLVITLDPIFSGLAWAIIFGIAASTLFTLVVIPVVYYLVYDRRPHHGFVQKEGVA
jgi:multidrug efflux pump subunit AcrB